MTGFQNAWKKRDVAGWIGCKEAPGCFLGWGLVSGLYNVGPITYLCLLLKGYEIFGV